MEGIAPAPVDILHSPEVLNPSHETVGVQARFLLSSEALRPDNVTLPVVKKEDLDPSHIDYTKVDAALEKVSNEYWKDTDIPDRQASWTKQMQERFTDYGGFWQSDTGKAYQTVFENIGFTTTNIATDTTTISTFYETYFSDDTKTPTEKFSDTVLQKYTKTDGHLDYNRLMADKDALNWIGHTIDGSGLDIVGEIITTRANFKHQPDAMVTAVNHKEAGQDTTRLNKPTDKEVAIMTLLHTPDDYLIENPPRLPSPDGSANGGQAQPTPATPPTPDAGNIPPTETLPPPADTTSPPDTETTPVVQRPPRPVATTVDTTVALTAPDTGNPSPDDETSTPPIEADENQPTPADETNPLDNGTTNIPDTIETTPSGEIVLSPLESKKRAMLDHQIKSLVSRFLIEKDLTPAEETTLRQHFQDRLALVGITVSNPNDTEALRQAYIQMRQKELAEAKADPSLDYDKFCREHPYVIAEGMQIQTQSQEHVILQAGTSSEVRFPIEQVNASDITIITVPDKEQDAVGITKRADGVVNIALADGVTNSVLPKFAARTSVIAALEQMTVGKPSLATFEHAFNTLQAIDAENMAILYERKYREQAKNETDPIRKGRLNDAARKLEGLRDTSYDSRSKFVPALALTTLVVAQYDKAHNRLRIGVKGDSQAVVFKKDGTFRTYTDPTNQQLYYDVQPGHSYRVGGEIIEDITLDDGDVFLLNSDGLAYENVLDNINDRIKTARITGDDINEKVTEYVRSELKTGVGDDVSVVIGVHEAVPNQNKYIPKPGETILLTPDEGMEVSITAAPKDEAENILTTAEIHGDAYQGERLTTDILKSEGLEPKFRFQVGNVTWMSSEPYTLGDGRIAVVAYLPQKNGQPAVMRTFYRSNSSGMWRYLPNYRMNSNNSDIDWFSKGHGEESITLPMTMQRSLAEISNDGVLLPANPKLIFAGTARRLPRVGTYMREIDSTPQNLEGTFYQADHKVKTPPERVMLNNPQQSPDFSKVITTWNQPSSLYGDIAIEVIPSKDGQLNYMFCRSGGRAWIGGIEATGGEIGTCGLKQNWINGGDLTTPAFEYSGYTDKYGNPALRDGPYVDMYANYISKFPIIQEYLSVRP